MAGSAATAREAADQAAYTLVDRATFLTSRPALVIVAGAFVYWLLGEQAQRLIGDFGHAEHGVALFLRRDHIPTPDS